MVSGMWVAKLAQRVVTMYILALERKLSMIMIQTQPPNAQWVLLY